MTLALLRLLAVLFVLSASTRLARVILLDALRYLWCEGLLIVSTQLQIRKVHHHVRPEISCQCGGQEQSAYNE